MISVAKKRQVVAVLLALWNGALNKSELIARAKKKSESVKDYHLIINDLMQDGMIEVVGKSKVKFALLLPGKLLLKELLCDSEFEFTASIGKRSANALLGLMRFQDEVPSVPLDEDYKNTIQALNIQSYKDFQETILEILETLNQDFYLNNLVPIYRVRRSIGDQVKRKDFDVWLLEMQVNDLIQLVGGEMPGLTPEISEDSIKTTLGAPRYYIKRT